MTFTVIIATYKRPEMLRRTLRSLEQAAPPQSKLRIIVVENGERAGAEEICASSALTVEYQFVEQAGSGRARQHALDQLENGFVLFLDDDVSIAPDLFVAYERAVAQHGSQAFYGGPITTECEQAPPPWLMKFLPPSVTGWNADHSWPWFLGANYGAFVEAIQRVGGLSLTLGPGAMRVGTASNPTGLETDLEMRLAAAGYRQVYVPEAVVCHYVEAESCTPEWALHRHYRNTMSRALRGEGASGRLTANGVPVRLYASLLKNFAKSLVASVVGNAETRFKAQYHLHGCRGRITGARERARQQDGA